MNDTDVRGENIFERTINIQSILYGCVRRKPFATICLLDCCRSCNLLGSSAPVGLAKMEETGSLIAFACAAGTESIEGDGQRNGLFTKYLLRNICRPNEDIGIVLRSVKDEVIKETSGKQRPIVYDSLRQIVYLHGQPSGERTLTR